MVQGTSFASKIGKWWPAAMEVRPKTSFEIGHDSMAIFFSLKISMSKGCLAIAYPWPIRLAFKRIASKRLPSTLSPTSRVSPQWKRNGISRFFALHFFRNSRNSGMKCRSSFPISSWPTRSKPLDCKSNQRSLLSVVCTHHIVAPDISTSELYTLREQPLPAPSRKIEAYSI